MEWVIVHKLTGISCFCKPACLTHSSPSPFPLPPFSPTTSKGQSLPTKGQRTPNQRTTNVLTLKSTNRAPHNLKPPLCYLSLSIKTLHQPWSWPLASPATSVQRTRFEPAINDPCRLALTYDSGGLLWEVFGTSGITNPAAESSLRLFKKYI